jgi:hypothetical protein
MSPSTVYTKKKCRYTKVSTLYIQNVKFLYTLVLHYKPHVHTWHIYQKKCKPDCVYTSVDDITYKSTHSVHTAISPCIYSISTVKQGTARYYTTLHSTIKLLQNTLKKGRNPPLFCPFEHFHPRPSKNCPHGTTPLTHDATKILPKTYAKHFHPLEAT